MTPRVKIFLVDDHEVVLRGLRMLLDNQTDFEICGEALDAPTALAGIARTQPHLAVIDLRLGRSSGLELLKDLALQQSRVLRIVLTMHDEWEMVERVMRAGAQGYVCKDEAGDTIVTAIRAVLDGQSYISPKLASQLAGQFFHGQFATDELPALSDCEREIFELMAGGAQVNAIATQLGRSPKTIHTHCDHMKIKFGVRTGHELQLLAVRWKTRREPR